MPGFLNCSGIQVEFVRFFKIELAYIFRHVTKVTLVHSDFNNQDPNCAAFSLPHRLVENHRSTSKLYDETIVSTDSML